MFKGFQDNGRSSHFNGFPNLNFQMNNEAYGFSGCTLWLDAAFGLNTQTNGASVIYWFSKFGNNVARQSTAAQQPLLILNDVNFNNNPSLNFKNVNQRRMTFDFSVGLNHNSCTVAIVYKINAISTSFNALLTAGTTGTAGTYPVIIAKNGTTDGEGISAEGTNYFINDAANTTTPKISIITNDVIIRNGVASSTIGSCANLPSFSNIGNGTNANHPDCDIAEILIFNKKLSSDECIMLSGNINSKYAIY